MLKIFAVALLALTARAQTQIDLRTQSKGVDFTGAPSTKPMKMGTALPASCAPGEMFFSSGAPAGANLYACTATNSWATQGANTVESNGQVVGTRATTNFTTGPGLLSIASDTGSNIQMQWALDTAVNQTQEGEQSGTALLCLSNSGSGVNYGCSMAPTASAYTAGMVVHWQPDVNGAGGPTTLNIDTLGATPVKLADGASNPTPGDIRAGRLYEAWYDGTNFRLMPTTAAAVGAAGDAGTNGVLYRSGPGAASVATADQMSGPFFCQDTSSAAGAYACNLTPAISAYNAGTTYWFKAKTANSGAATVNFNSTGAAAIKKQSNVNLAPGDIAAGQWVMLTYDGTNMQMLSQTATAAAGGVSSVFGRAGAITAQSGDYTTAQVTESNSLYFTNARAVAALSGLYQTPITTGTTAQYFRGDLSLATFPATWSWSALTGLPTLTNTVFGRSGAVTAQSGDYTTSQVSEGSNLYFTNARAVAALSGLYQTPISGAPPAWPSFATVATSGSYSDLTNKPTIPAASSANPAMNGTAAPGSSSSYARADHVHPTDTSRQAAITGAPSTWPATFPPPPPTASTLGGVEATDCSLIGMVQKIDTDGTVACAAGGSATPSINTSYVKVEDEFTCPTSNANGFCLPWYSGGTGAANHEISSVWPHIGVISVGGSNSSPGNYGSLTNYNNNSVLGQFSAFAANGPWEMDWIFALAQTTNTAFTIGFDTAGNYAPDAGTFLVGVRYYTNSTYNDSTFMFCAFSAATCVSSGVAADTNYHHLKVTWISANKIGFTLDGGTQKTACLNGGGCDISVGSSWSTNGSQFKVACGSDTVAAATAVYVDYFGFLANVGTR